MNKRTDVLKFEPHHPEHYIAGVYIPQTKVWVGEFEATTHELVNYATHELIGDAELELISMMIESQTVYEEWWTRMQYSK